MRLASITLAAAALFSAPTLADAYDYDSITLDTELTIYEAHIGGNGVISGFGEAADGVIYSFMVVDGESTVFLDENIRFGRVNELGQIAGGYLSRDFAFMYSSSDVDKFDVLYGTHYGNSINDYGSICGDANDKYGNDRSWVRHADGSSLMLDTLYSDIYTWSFDINNKNMAIGWSAPDATVRTPVLWDKYGAAYEMDTLPNTVKATPMALNDDVISAGFIELPNYAMVATRWDGTDVERLPNYGFLSTVAMSVNQAGTIVGAGMDASWNFAPVLWGAGGGMQDLSEFLPEDVTGFASSINDEGMIVGFNGNLLFTLTPSDEDCSGCGSIQPDLTITAEEATISGMPFVLVSVFNAGNDAVSETTVELFVNPAEAPALGEQSNQFYTIRDLQAGETHYHIVPATSGSTYAVVDSLDQVAESDESNNIAAITID